MSRYWIATLIGLVVAGASIVAIDWGIYHLVRTGTCASGGPYVSARPCPPGTGLHIGALIGGIFAGLFAIGIYAARGRYGTPSRIGLGLIMWSLLFITLAGSTALAAFGPANNDDQGARVAAIVLGVTFLPMGLLPLLVGLRRGPKERPVVTGGATWTPSPGGATWRPTPVAGVPPTAQPGPSPQPAPEAGDPLAQIERLGRLRDQGLLTQEEFEEQKRRLLGEL